MIDLDREEFLQRLDVRLCFISNLMETNEQYIISMVSADGENSKKLSEQNRKYHKDLIDWIAQKDKEIKEQFAKLKSDIAKENCDNDKS